jgi:hypothetical protein
MVDAGDMAPFEKLNSQGRLKIETMARAMATMDYQAITLGDRNLAPGPEFVARIAEWVEQPILATNYDLPGGASERTRVVTVRERRIGLAAFLDPDLVMDVDWLDVEPWENQRARMDDLRSRCDVLVVLLHSSQGPSVLRLAELYPEIDLILSAHEGLHAGPIFKHGNTYIAGSASRGRHLGRVEVVFTPDDQIAEMASAYLPVVEAWGRRPWTDSLLADYYADMRDLVSSDAFMLEQMASLEEPPVEFVGNEACMSCHETEGAQWESTPHSHARQTLVEAEKDHDPECQACHTTGFGFRTGFANPEATSEMWEVGCESCHGGGADHVESQEEAYGSVTEAVCRSCHDEDQSPDFSFSVYRPKVAHTAEGPDR